MYWNSKFYGSLQAATVSLGKWRGPSFSRLWLSVSIMKYANAVHKRHRPKPESGSPGVRREEVQWGRNEF